MAARREAARIPFNRDPDVPSCYVTPHEAAFTPIAANEIARLACQNAVAALRGRHDRVYEYIVGPFAEP